MGLTFDRPFYLELGAGYRPTPGFIHNDFNEGDDIEIVCGAEEIENFVDTPVDHLRATHLLEHFPYNDTVKVLKAWYNILAEQGELYIEVPNLQWQTQAHVIGEINDEEAVRYIYGEQDFKGNFHYAAFTVGLLEKRLKEAGFKTVEVWSVTQVVCARAFKM